MSFRLLLDILNVPGCFYRLQTSEFPLKRKICPGTNQKCHEDFQLEFWNRNDAPFDAFPYFGASTWTLDTISYPFRRFLCTQTLTKLFWNFQKSGNTNVRLRKTRFTGILQSGTAICPRVMFFGAFQRSWVCWGPLFTDLRSYDRARRLVVHKSVTFQAFRQNAGITKMLGSTAEIVKQPFFSVLSNVHGCVEVPCSRIYDRMSELGD